MKKIILIKLIIYSFLNAAAMAQENPNASVPDTVLVYSPEFFATSNPATALDMVERVPGFQIDDGDDVRGFAGAGANVLINGARPASKSDDVSDALNRIQSGRVSHIELIRGSTPGIDMQGHSVVANVVLTDEISREHAVTGRGYFFEGGPQLPGAQYEFNASQNGHNWGFNIGRSISMSDSTGWGTLTQHDANGNLLLRETVSTGFDGGGWDGRASWTLPFLAGKLELTGGRDRNEFEDWKHYGTGQNQRRFDYYNVNHNADIGVRSDQALSPTLNLETRLIHNRRKREMFNGADTGTSLQRFDTLRQTGESIFRNVLRWQAQERLRVEGGGEIAYNFLDTDQQFTIDGNEVDLALSTTRVSELRGEVFSILTWQFSDNLSVEAGGRFERSTIRQKGNDGNTSTERSFSYFKPRLATTWDMTETQQLRLRLERELGQLDFSDFAASSSLANDQVLDGNLDLRPQQRWISEMVYEYRFADSGAISLTLRHDEITDVVDVVPLENGLTAIGNIGDGTLDRARIDLRTPLHYLGLQNARLTIEAQYDHSRVTDPTTDATRSITDVRPFDSRIQLEQDIPRLNLTWGVEYLPYFKDTTFNPDQRRSFELHNYWILYGEYTISPGFTVRGQATVWDDMRLQRDVWADRQTQQLALSEKQRLNPRNFFRLTVRKQF